MTNRHEQRLEVFGLMLAMLIAIVFSYMVLCAVAKEPPNHHPKQEKCLEQYRYCQPQK